MTEALVPIHMGKEFMDVIELSKYTSGLTIKQNTNHPWDRKKKRIRITTNDNNRIRELQKMEYKVAGYDIIVTYGDGGLIPRIPWNVSGWKLR